MKKVLFAAIVWMLVMSVLVPLTATKEYEIQDTHSGHLVPSSTEVEVWEAFNVTLYINSSSDSVADFTVRQYMWNGTRARVGQNPGGTMNTDLNCSWFSPWISGFSRDDGNLNNTDGENSYGPQCFSITETNSGNHSAARFNMTGIYPGPLHIYIPWESYGGNPGLEIGSAPADFWTNCTVMIYPQQPAAFSATTWNHTAINLTWTLNNVSDAVTLCGKTGSYPTGPTDSVLYNGTNLLYDHTDLDNCTTYYYRAWSYNESSGWHSMNYRSATATTSCYTNISLLGANPANDSSIANCTYSQTVNVTVRNSKGKTCLYWINASNGQSTSGSVLNNSISLSLTSLSHNTTYWWNVTVSEQGTTDSTGGHYHFMTGEGGGSAPAGSNAYPNGLTGIPISPIDFAATGTDADGDPMDISFFFSDGTFIGNHNMTYSGNTANVSWATALTANTTYRWYALLNDTSGCGQSTRYPSSGYFSFTTEEALVVVTKEWMVHSNNTIQFWINVTNNGETDLTDGYINETWQYDNLTLTGANWTANGSDSGMYNITWLNQTNSTYLTMFFSLRTPLMNGTSLSDTATVYFNDTALNSNTPTNLPTMCFYATKETNESVIYWNTSDVNFTISVINCGDFYMNWTQINETYHPNLTYWESDVIPNATDETFNITSQIGPGETSEIWIKMNLTDGEPVNGTNIWNNITVGCNDSSSDITVSMYMPVGATTEFIRITYDAQLTEVVGFGNSVLTILGILLIIGSIFLIVLLINRGGLFGGGE